MLKQKKQSLRMADRLRMQRDSKDLLVEGSTWLTVGGMVSRLLGALYVIPWVAMMGSHVISANYLFYVAYTIYALVLQISTAGIPVAVAKIVADNSAKQAYGTSWRIFKHGMVFMGITGLVSAIAMYLLAPVLAKGTNPQEVADSIFVIRSLTPAMAIIPGLSLMRGYYQGYSEMAPSAKSQLWEQIIRIIYMLLATYIIMKVLGGSYVVAVAHSTFAAFVGGLVGIGYLAYQFWRDFPGMKQLIQEGQPTRQVSFLQIAWQVVREAMPFVLVTSCLQIISLIDTQSFYFLTRIFTKLNFEEAKNYLTIIGFNANKIIMIIVSLAVSISSSALPLLASYSTGGKMEDLRKVIEDNLALFFFVMVPACLGMAILAFPMYTIFYFPDLLGAKLLALSCILCMVFGLQSIFSSMVLSIQEYRIAIRGLALTLVLKLLWQPLSLYLFGGQGPIWSSILALLTGMLYYAWHIWRISRFSLRQLGKDLGQILILSTLMGLACLFVYWAGSQFLSVESKLHSLILIGLVAVVGIAIYTVLSLYTGLAEQVIGSKAKSLKAKLRIPNRHES